MSRILPVSVAVLLAVGLAQPALGQGRGNDGQGKGKGKSEAAGQVDRGGAPKGKGKGQDRDDRDRDGERGDRQGPGAAKGKDRDRGDRDDDRREPALVRQERRDDERRGPPGDRGRDRGDDRIIVVDDRRRDDRVVVVDGRRDPRIVVFNADPGRGLIAGCPPGLAKRNNGCLPPGQERKLERELVRDLRRDAVIRTDRARYDRLWDLRFADDYAYRYDGGYLYRYDRQQNSLLGWLPVLAGALSVGNLWPAQYSYDPAPNYYSSYYGLNDPYDYRYAGGALYGVDPQTQAIQSVAALLTGQSPQLGQRMPPGYDVYNVPYGWRDQYRDGPSSLYRYNDGYLYQLDPTTQVVQAIIQLLT